jgi:hypothetical protein
MPARRFPPPWSVEDNGACFIVRDHGGQKLAYIYYEVEPVAGTKDTTKKYRFNSRCEAFLARRSMSSPQSPAQGGSSKKR